MEEKKIKKIPIKREKVRKIRLTREEEEKINIEARFAGTNFANYIRTILTKGRYTIVLRQDLSEPVEELIRKLNSNQTRIGRDINDLFRRVSEVYTTWKNTKPTEEVWRDLKPNFDKLGDKLEQLIKIYDTTIHDIKSLADKETVKDRVLNPDEYISRLTGGKKVTISARAIQEAPAVPAQKKSVPTSSPASAPAPRPTPAPAPAPAPAPKSASTPTSVTPKPSVSTGPSAPTPTPAPMPKMEALRALMRKVNEEIEKKANN